MFDTTADETATVMSNVVIVVINLNVWDEMGHALLEVTNI